MKHIIPLGVRDYLPNDYQKKSNNVKKALHLFEEKGYKAVATPMFEYWSTIEPLCSETLKDKVVKFINSKGEIIALRPDHTIGISRLASTWIKENPSNLKLCYADPVYRLDPVTGETERFQLGVENIGNSGVESEAELIQTCAESLSSLGLHQISIEINHTKTLNSYDTATQNAFKTRDYTNLSQYPKRCPLSDISSDHPLSELRNQLDSKSIKADLYFNESIQTTTQYYNGFFFECCVNGEGKKIGNGGRYDKLLENFDHQVSAIGFGLNYSVIEGILS